MKENDRKGEKKEDFHVPEGERVPMRRAMERGVVLTLLVILFLGVSFWFLQPDEKEMLPQDIPVFGYEIVNTFPHDKHAFTEGLVFSDGILIEGTGLTGQSTLRKVQLETGEILELQRLPDEYFGEGTFPCPVPAWGLTCDGRNLIVSDGSDRLTFIDPGTFRPLRQIKVRAGGVSVRYLNELEYVEGEIYANIWPTDRIARISPQSGEVTGWIDLEGILSPSDRTEAGIPENISREGGFSSSWTCLNGIAYDPGDRRLFVTGKLWPTLYEIRLRPSS
jgi:glutamine cyclotransferase